MKAVKFDRSMSPYQPGEIASFEDERATDIVEKLKAARYLTREEQASLERSDAERHAQAKGK